MTLEGGIAPEFAYVTAKFAALAPFAKVADLLAELLPVGGAINAGTVRNRTRRVGEQIARLRPEGAADPDIDAVTPAVVIGLDGGYLRSRHRRPERNFEVIAGKVLNLDGSQHRFAFARNGNSVSEFANAVVSAGIRLGTPATVLCDGDPGLWKLQRQVMPDATLVLDWFHIAMRFEHALQAARGLGAGTSSGYLRSHPIRELESSKWRLWHGRSSACLGRLARLAIGLTPLMSATSKARAAAQRHINDLIEYLDANRLALVNYGQRRHDRQPISTAFVESAVNEILSKRMIKSSRCDGTGGPCSLSSTCALPFSTRRSPAHSGGSIQISNQTMKITQCALQLTNPTTLHALLSRNCRFRTTRGNRRPEREWKGQAPAPPSALRSTIFSMIDPSSSGYFNVCSLLWLRDCSALRGFSSGLGLDT